jgi:ribosomal-protein-alanine N-acetyltransferase
MVHLGTKKLESERLILRRIMETDAEEIYLGFVNQEGFLYYANKEKRTLEEEKNSLIGIDEKYKNLNYYNWLITLKDNKKIIGSINLRVEEINETVEFNYAIDERFSNNGYMTEALKLVKEYCLNELKVNRFQGGCCIDNKASKRVMEKCNMQCEGILRNYLKLKDGYHDMYMFSIINA